ncbi:MAG: transglutaminaseTgpA domain-containing protein [Actinomycetes bacterium]
MSAAAPRATLTALAASLLVCLTLFTLVDGVWWFVEASLVAVAVVAAGAGARRLVRTPWVALAAQLVALLTVLTWLYSREETIAGLLPGLASTTRLLEVGAAGMEIIRTSAAPAPAEDGIRLLAAAGVGAVALVVDLVAVGLRQPAAAGLPLLAVYAVPAALAPGGLDWYWFVLAGTGYLVLVASDAGERVARWGRVLHGRGGEAAPLAATGRRVGAVALAGAVIVPTVVPGLDEALFFGTGIGDGPGDGGRIEVVNPIYSLRDNLGARSDTTVLEYETTGAPQPLRIVTVDSFDGTTWEPTLGTLPRSNTAASGMPTPPGLGDDVATTEQRYRITIRGLRQTWLPVPYPPTRVDILGPWLYDDALNVIGDGVSTEEGLSYDVRYLEVTPTPEQLQRALPPPADVVSRWTVLPEDLPEVVTRTAQEVAGDGTAYEQAVRLQQFFRGDGGFQYSVAAPDANSPNAIADFLARRSGYCVHFASAMAVMSRTLGIPARVAVGFLPGGRQPDGRFEVSLRDAHAWPELFFAGIGWVRFEPTPSTRTGGLPSWAAPPPSVVAPDVPGDTPSAAAPLPGRAPGSTSDASVGTADGGLSVGQVLAAVPWRAVAAVALVLTLLSSPAGAAALVRRRRYRLAAGSPDPGGATAEAAWATLHERALDLGVPVPASATPRQAESGLAAVLPDDGRAPLHRLARGVEQARYARAAGEGSVSGLRHDAATVAHLLADGVPRGARWRARLMPASGARHLRSALVETGLAVDSGERALAARLRRGLGRVSASVRRGAGPSAPRDAA